jgi:hypothetical protein
MGRKLRILCGAALLVGCAAVGCTTKNHAVRDKPPSDPLLVSKKPVEGKANATAPVRTAFQEPSPPPLPAPDVTTVNGTAPGANLLSLHPVPR